MRKIIGIDPGLSGAIALYNPSTKSVDGLWDMPLKPHPKKPNKNIIDSHTLVAIIEVHAPDVALAVVERVHSMPEQGVVSTFNFGFAAGIVEGILSAALIPFYYTEPAVWKALMGLSHDKNLSRAKASQLFLNQQEMFKRKKDDGRAEAALLAVFGTRFLDIQPPKNVKPH